MPRAYEMTWDQRNSRWRKLYKGERYVVSCRQLNALETKEGSYRAANSWWIAKKAELDGGLFAPGYWERWKEQNPAIRYPHHSQIATMERWRQWALDHGERDLADQITSRIEALKALGPDEPRPLAPSTVDSLEIARALGVTVPDDLGSELVEMVFGGGGRALWIDRLARDKGRDEVLADRTVGGQFSAWLDTRRSKVEAGDVTPRNFDNSRIAVGHFVAFCGSGTPVSSLNADFVERYFHHSAAKIGSRERGAEGWSRRYATTCFSEARRFVRYLWEKGLLELPRNLDSRDFRLKNAVKKVPTMTVEEVRSLVAAATGQLKLYLLLMVNCGMTQKDISDLRDDEVDWERGRITRKRSKTRGQKNVPTVEYPLWPSTFALLRRYRSGGETVLLTSCGTPLLREEILNGRVKRKDEVSSVYGRLKERVGGEKPLKYLRKTSATLLEGHREYGRVVDQFLGRAPQTMAQRHYAAPPEELHAEAVAWLGGRYGLAEAELFAEAAV
jgi:integrase